VQYLFRDLLTGGNELSEQWYYAEEEKPVGPFSLADLIDALKRLANGERILVWSASLGSWKKAEDVPEIVAHIKKPPPVPKPVVGLGGWLGLLGLGLILNPIRFFVQSLAYYLGKETLSAWQQFPAAMVSELVIDTLLFFLMFRALVLFASKSKRFPRFYIRLWIATICLTFVKLVDDALIISIYSGKPMGELIGLGLNDEKQMAALIAVAFWGLIWTVYLLKSKRVANTFVEP
jgi:Protein of unknown function (DUF2569)/GYF domain 2